MGVGTAIGKSDQLSKCVGPFRAPKEGSVPALLM